MVPKRQKERQVFVVDTSIPMHNPNFEMTLGNNDIVIPFRLIGELDGLKTESGSRGFLARQASHKIGELLCKAMADNGWTAGRGIKIPETGGVIYFIDCKEQPNLKTGLSLGDEIVIKTAQNWREKNIGKRVVIVSKDTNLRSMSALHGVRSEDYQFDRVSDDALNYTGLTQVNLPHDLAGYIHQLSFRSKLTKEEVKEIPGNEQFEPNQAIEITYGDQHAVGIYLDGQIEIVRNPKNDNRFSAKGIKPMNYEQAVAFTLLGLSTVDLVTISGVAGSGKTLIALASAFKMQEAGLCDRVVVYRPSWELGKELGFLPGDIGSKFSPWQTPVYDALKMVFQAELSVEKANSRNNVTGSSKSTLFQRMIDEEVLEIAPINFIQGRTLNRAIIIVDETQNLTPTEAKALVTRSGQGSKMVMTGDLTQISNNYVDPYSNGFSHTIDSMRKRTNPSQRSIYGHICLPRCVRSNLALIGGEVM